MLLSPEREASIRRICGALLGVLAVLVAILATALVVDARRNGGISASNGEILGTLEASVVMLLLVPLLVLLVFSAVGVWRKRAIRVPPPVLVILALWAIIAVIVS